MPSFEMDHNSACRAQGASSSRGSDHKPLDESILVFRHNDLNMRNFILDDEDLLWVQCIGITFHTILIFLFYSGHNMKITKLLI
jgi:hypothetical protein